MKKYSAVMIGGTMMGAALAAAGCQPTVKVEPIEVKPIHVTVDVNFKVDHELDNFFDYEKPASNAPPAPANNAAPQPQGGA